MSSVNNHDELMEFRYYTPHCEQFHELIVLIESSLSSSSSPTLVVAATRRVGLGLRTGVVSGDRSGSVSDILLSVCSSCNISNGGSTIDEHMYRSQF